MIDTLHNELVQKKKLNRAMPFTSNETVSWWSYKWWTNILINRRN